MLLTKSQRKRNQKYHAEEFRTPFILYSKKRISQTSQKQRLTKLMSGLALTYAPSAKDRDVLGERMQSTSLTLIMPQQNSLEITTDTIIGITEPRLNSDGFFDVIEVVPDIANGRYLKLLLNRTKHGAGFEVADE